MAEFILPLIIGIAVFIGVFILLREFFCWYFKINESVRVQKLTAETLLKLYEQNGGTVIWENVNKIIK
jgi:hypothetical protein